MRYFFSFLAAIGLIIVVFILVLRGFSSHTPASKINLLDYSDSDTVVQLTVDGPINANEIHKRYRITVGRDFNTIETSKGYEGLTTSLQTYPNNSEAYANFLRALDIQGFIKGDPNPARADDRGYCPDGSRYIFEIVSDSKRVQRYWSTSCGKGTYGGNSAETRQLFVHQIPDATKILNAFAL